MAEVQRHLVVVGDAGFVQDLFKSLGYWSMHRGTAKRMGKSKMFDLGILQVSENEPVNVPWYLCDSVFTSCTCSRPWTRTWISMM